MKEKSWWQLSFVILVATIFVFIVVEPTYSGWLGRARQSIRRSTNRAKQRIHRSMNRAKRSFHRRTQRAKRSFHRRTQRAKRSFHRRTQRAKRSFHRKYRRTREKIRHSRKNIQRRSREYIRQTRKKVKRIYNRTKQKIRQRTGAVKSFTKKHSRRTIYNVRRATEGLSRRASKTLSRVYRREGKRIASFFQSLHLKAKKSMLYVYDIYGRNNFYRLKRLCDKRGGKRFGEEASLAIYRAGKYIKNPVNRKKVLVAVVTGAILIHEIRTNSKELVVRGARSACRNVYLVDENGRKINLEQYSQNWVVKNAPYLEGTSIAEDPIGAVTYVMVFQDTDYITSEMKIVKDPKNGEYISMKQALIETAPLETEKTIAVLENIENFETLTDGESDPDDILAAYQMIQNVNQVLE